MIFASLAFYLFAVLAVVSGVFVITARNPVHSVLALILAFFNAAGLFVLLGAEYLAMTLVVVYVGAVAVLFLFVVMMLDIDFNALAQGARRHIAVGLIVGLILLAELLVVAAGWSIGPFDPSVVQASPTPMNMTNTQAIGTILYTQYVYVFQMSGLILFVAMIGAIVLTHRRRDDVRRQNIGEQVAKPRVIDLVKVTTGSGV